MSLKKQIYTFFVSICMIIDNKQLFKAYINLWSENFWIFYPFEVSVSAVSVSVSVVSVSA